MISNVLIAAKGRRYLGKIILNLSVKCEIMHIIISTCLGKKMNQAFRMYDLSQFLTMKIKSTLTEVSPLN